MLSSAECIDRLRGGRLGRIGMSHRALPTIVPVAYDIVGTSVMFPVLDGGMLVAAAGRGDIVCFQADSVDATDRERWNVVVVGKLALSPKLVGIDMTSIRSDRASLPMTLVSGRAGRSENGDDPEDAEWP
ncbi:MAG: pyridoxamine 5'-phosphate oxidase family protein [Ilumatobacteraceae bacterium]